MCATISEPEWKEYCRLSRRYGTPVAVSYSDYCKHYPLATDIIKEVVKYYHFLEANGVVGPADNIRFVVDAMWDSYVQSLKDLDSELSDGKWNTD